ncbi:hypothetical protein OF897_18845 [Chryseobacterium formosus]|uniref:Lipoprotein n=1 Tax=Chryseobacterium formosus TaxID=1537363 RepID=A0ABT3XWB4_9FLAO|nr:hypothetical protein [Chryseobacterium formosus]MCX8525976.1 hypothetical protein [Chryseobacterium formosus]
MTNQKNANLRKLINVVITLYLLIIISCTNAKEIVGEYSRSDNYSKCILDLKSNNTYLYGCYSHLLGDNCSYGTWKIRKNTMYFMPKLLYDTIRLKNKDTLIISSNYPPELINRKDTENYNNLMYLAQSQLGLFSQNISYIFPQKN